MNSASTIGPYQTGLRRTVRGIGAVYLPLSSGAVYRPTREVDAVVRPDDEPLRCARPGPRVPLGAMGAEDRRGSAWRRKRSGADPLVPSWGCRPASWSSTTTTR